MLQRSRSKDDALCKTERIKKVALVINDINMVAYEKRDYSFHEVGVGKRPYF